GDQSAKFAQNKFPAAHGAGEDGVQSLLLNFLGNQADADENGDDQAEQRDGGQAQVDDYVALDADGDLANEQGSRNHQQGKADEVVEDAVANGLAKSVGRDGGDAVHRAATSAGESFSTK